jgi:flagellar biosynthesis anti-sigma factor FlgM
MSDPINGINTSSPITPATTAGTTVATSTTADAAVTANLASPAAAVADVGQTEALLQSIVQAANNVPGIDQGKVAELQKAITSGSYQANPQSIVQKLVELENLLGTAGAVR